MREDEEEVGGERLLRGIAPVLRRPYDCPYRELCAPGRQRSPRRMNGKSKVISRRIPYGFSDQPPSTVCTVSYNNPGVSFSASIIFSAAGPASTTMIAGKMNRINGAISLTVVFWARSSAA